MGFRSRRTMFQRSRRVMWFALAAGTTVILLLLGTRSPASSSRRRLVWSWVKKLLNGGSEEDSTPNPVNPSSAVPMTQKRKAPDPLNLAKKIASNVFLQQFMSTWGASDFETIVN